MQMAAMGEPGAILAGELMKFQLAPYRAGRQLSGAVDKFIDAAPEMAAKAAAQAGAGAAGSEELARANTELAKAENLKAQAAMLTAQAKAEAAQTESQRKIFELQQKGAIEADKHQRESEKLQQQMQEMGSRETLLQAQVDNLTANTAKILASIGLDERKQQLSEYTAADNSQARATDQAMAADGQQAEHSFRQADQQRAERGENRADRQQEFTEATTPTEGESQ
jgi:DNA polymerase III alpha subunit (gram-positive type)